MSYLDRIRLSIDPETLRVESHGVDFGPLELVATEGRVVVVRNAGHTYWSSIGSRSYASAKFLVFALVDSKESIWKLVIEFPTKKQPRPPDGRDYEEPL